jgi:A/G-specific adenine glycosylase
MASTTTRVETRLKHHALHLNVFRKFLLAWFRKEGRTFPWRDPDASTYVRVVSEILLQRTRAETVSIFFPRFVRRFPGWDHLAAATDDELRAFLEPIGLWRRRALSLRLLGNEIQARKGCFPSTRAEIEALPGIGQYIASAVMLFCHGDCQPLLDVNMARVLERCFGARKLADIRYDPWLQALSRRIVKHRLATQINWAILDLASKICTIRQPQCASCPLSSCCRYALTNWSHHRGSDKSYAKRPESKPHVRLWSIQHQSQDKG